MRPFTSRLWAEQNRHPGDRQGLFQAVGGFLGVATVLYPGSFVDIPASFVFDDVLYVDTDRRAKRFFDDVGGVDELILEQRPDAPTWRFSAADYTTDLDVADGSFDLLISLYAGLVSDACTRYLKPGGWLLDNPSHGDVALAALDDRYQLAAVVTSRSGAYQVRDDALDSYLIAKRDTPVTAEHIRASGRGVADTKSAFAYLFQRVA